MQDRLVNCTPHKIVIERDGKVALILEPSGFVPRVSTKQGTIDEGVSTSTGAQVFSADIRGAVTGMPIQKRHVWYVVSGMVGAALKGQRGDILVPGTGPSDNPIREAGRIVAVTRLKRV